MTTEPARTRAPWTLDPDTVFLNHGSYGACPLAVQAAQGRLRDELERDPVLFFARRYEPLLDETRRRVAALIGASADDLVLVTNATHAVNAVLCSLRLEPGDELVVTSHGYPAVNNAARRWAERAGAKVVVADVPFPIAGPEVATAAVVASLSDKTRLVIVDQVTSPTALVLPVESLVRACRERGVEVLVDAAHAPGMVTMGVEASGAGYTTGNLHKWICAPKGAAFLHVRRDLSPSLGPLVTSHGASSTRTDRSRLQLEFDWTGTYDPTALLSVPAAIDALGALHPQGLAGVMRDNHELAVQARSRLATRLGLELPCPAEMLGSMASLVLPDEPAIDAETLWARLYDRHRVQVPVFPWPGPGSRVVRISAQRYNRADDYDALAAALAVELHRT